MEQYIFALTLIIFAPPVIGMVAVCFGVIGLSDEYYEKEHKLSVSRWHPVIVIVNLIGGVLVGYYAGIYLMYSGIKAMLVKED